MEKHYLTPLFSPRSIVVLTHTAELPETSSACGQLALQNLRESGYSGRLEFLDIGAEGVLAGPAQSAPDLALIALPDADLTTALEMAGRMQSKTALLLSKAIDASQAQELHAIARRHGMHLLGPNTMGLQRPRLHLNASVLGTFAQEGSLALVSQSGALSNSVLDWAGRNGVGFSTVVSLGPNTGVDVADVLDFLADDRATHSIVVYLEGIRDARRFMSALRAAANAKPVIVLKAGRQPSGTRAALTHSGAIVGSDDVFDAALRRAGAVRVRSFVQLFTIAKCLSARHRPQGKRLAIVTNGGGPGVLAADWANDLGVTLTTLAPAALAELAPQLPAQASLDPLLDLSEDASAEDYRAAVIALAACNEVDGVLAILSPRPGLDCAAVAQALADLQPSFGKLVITCWMGDEQVVAARRILNQASIPTFRTPEAAVEAFDMAASFHQNQQLLQQTPSPLSKFDKPDIEGARILIETVLAERRKVLTEMESKALLAAFRIPVTRTILARSANEAMLIANQLGYPVALKIDSPDIPHKSDVEGVALNVNNAAGVRDTWQTMMANVKRRLPDIRINGITVQNMSGKPHGRELYIGLSTEEPFGPAISFGTGGRMIELIADRAIELPPLNRFLAQHLISRVRSAETLNEWRGAPAADREALERILMRVSEMVCELPQLREMDINPVIVDAAGALVVDARIVVEHAPSETVQYAHLAILPYPAEQEREWPLPGGGCYTLRPLHPSDGAMLQAFVRQLSHESRYLRFATAVSELSARMLARFTLIDYDREMALVAIHRDPGPDGAERVIAISRYITNPDSTSCEFSLVVADDFNGQGLGTRMMLSIMDVARSKGLKRIAGIVLNRNAPMLKLMRSLEFKVGKYGDDPDFRLCSREL
ncbi:bifunctional acetate--CoA ligase family protein/GNAT family N-acetyltransferase [Noviherbaspirillum sedimenti]|uniref:GNAT family N-acetyltransferase n=1 Tax=Noviherbaspirillum sedimenti TaxID=2320865 RepID=A0A3A3G0A4_9BURK|nr:bifunctional acetate--CoA ligase family protein/GNAT family N-acetyltransferase [Noviherbaspirillum sedimenti]RJG01065.1 GNAT family N-acetyltransferase [Noviherbaspirillum sedimenti]